ncbi:MAG: hypothetical protein DRN81_04625, partial [Thermoproteota archaeon]
MADVVPRYLKLSRRVKGIIEGKYPKELIGKRTTLLTTLVAAILYKYTGQEPTESAIEKLLGFALSGKLDDVFDSPEFRGYIRPHISMKDFEGDSDTVKKIVQNPDEDVLRRFPELKPHYEGYKRMVSDLNEEEEQVLSDLWRSQAESMVFSTYVQGGEFERLKQVYTTSQKKIDSIERTGLLGKILAMNYTRGAENAEEVANLFYELSRVSGIFMDDVKDVYTDVTQDDINLLSLAVIEDLGDYGWEAVRDAYRKKDNQMKLLSIFEELVVPFKGKYRECGGNKGIIRRLY